MTIKIPKYIAEVIEKNKGKKLSSVLYWGTVIALDKSPTQVEQWLAEKENQDTFARAWLDGYEVEEYSGVWKPKYDEDYYYINDEGDVLEDFWGDDFEDSNRLAIDNVFRTQKEAEDEVERRDVMQELKQFSCKFRYDEDNWLMFYDHEKLLEKIKLRNMFSGWKNDTKI